MKPTSIVDQIRNRGQRRPALPTGPATRPEVVSRAMVKHASIGQPVTRTAAAQAAGLVATAHEPIVQFLAEGALGMDPAIAERYITAEIQKAVRFDIESISRLSDGARAERLVCIGFITRRRRKRYTVVLPVQMVAQPVADALEESWAGLREKVRQDGQTRRDYAQANRHLETAIEMLHNSRQHLSDEELAFAIGAIGSEIVYL